MDQPAIVPVDVHHRHRWSELLAAKIRRAALRRRLERSPTRTDSLYDVDKAFAKWQHTIAERLQGDRLRFMQDKVEGIYTELCRLYLTVFQRSVMHPSVANYKVSVTDVLRVTPQNLLGEFNGRHDLLSHGPRDDLPFPARNPRENPLSDSWVAYQHDAVSGSWLFGHAGRHNVVYDARKRLVERWQPAMRAVFNKEYLQSLSSHATKSLDLFLDLSLPDQIKQVVVHDGVVAATEFIQLIDPRMLASELALAPACTEKLPRTDLLAYHARQEFREHRRRHRQLPDWAPTDLCGSRSEPSAEQLLAPLWQQWKDAREEARLLQPIADHLAQLASQTSHDPSSSHSAQSLGTEPRIANRIARVVYGIEPSTWARERVGF